AAVRVVDAWMCGAGAVRTLVRGVERQLGELRGLAPRLRIETRFAGHYGVPTTASLEATWLARSFGLVLEPIYTGKVLAALTADAAAGGVAGKRVLFLHSASTVDLRPWVAQAHPWALPDPLRALTATPPCAPTPP